MANSISGAGSEQSLLASYDAQQESSLVTLELWGFKERITKGVVKDLDGNQISEIAETSILGGDDQSITGAALLTYLTTKQLAPVQRIQKKGNAAWLVPFVLKDVNILFRKFIPNDFLESIKQQCDTKERADEFRSTLFNNGTQANQKSRLSEAIAWFTKALFVNILLEDKVNSAACYSNIGIVYRAFGEYRKAIQYHEKTLEIALEVNSREGEMKAYGNLGNAYLSLSDYEAAERCHQKHLEIAIEEKDQKSKGDAYGNLGIFYRHLGEYLKAIEYFENCLSISKENKDLEGQETTCGNFSSTYGLLEDDKKAIEYAEKCLSIAKERGSRKSEGTANGNLGNIYYHKKEYQRAIDYHEIHLRIAREVRSPEDEMRACGNLGNAYNALKDYEEAINYHKKNREIAQNLQYKESEAIANFNLGQPYFNQGNYTESEKALTRAIEIFSEIQRNLKRNEWKISIFEMQSVAYRKLECDYIVTNKAEKALEVCEEGRAKALYYLLSNSDTTFPLKVSEIQLIAKRDNTTFIIYSRSIADNAHVWVVRGNKLFSKSLELPVDIREEISLFNEENSKNPKEQSRGGRLTLESLIQPEEDTVDPNIELSENLKMLYQVFINPIEEWLPSDNGSITFIADAYMRDLPFSCLYKEKEKGKREYLIDRYLITTAPSVKVYDWSIKQTREISGHSLIVANPHTENEDDHLGGAAEEGESLASKLPNPELLAGKKVTEENLLNHLAKASYIHIACHGLAEERMNIDSVFEGALRLADQDNKVVKLFADQIPKKLDANLVFLSACDSGKGSKKQEGVIGLSRAFLGAGVPAVIATHWKISDNITQSIAVDFYDCILNKNMTNAEALREAMLTQRKTYPGEPYLWGAFFLMGK